MNDRPKEESNFLHAGEELSTDPRQTHDQGIAISTQAEKRWFFAPR